MSSLVSLPMYDPPGDATAVLWAGFRRHMRAAGLDGVPDSLARPGNLRRHWTDPDLLLSQTCGYPLTTELAGKVQLVATPCYRAAGCDGPFYTSVMIVREDDPARAVADLRGRRAAFNERGSQSGYNALRAQVAPHAQAGGFFRAVVESGSHRRSLLLVQTGAADVAAVDCVTYALLRRHEPETVRGLRVLGRTAPGVPGLPLITSRRTSAADLERLRAALAGVARDPELGPSRDALLLGGFAIVPLDAYAACGRMEDEAKAAGYPELA